GGGMRPRQDTSGETRRSGLRLVWATVAATALVVGTLSAPSSFGGLRAGNLLGQYDASKAAAGLPHADAPGTPAHDHNDPATKNAVSRAAETSAETQDPTTAPERRASTAYVASQ